MVCVACNGTKVNSKGNPCPICSKPKEVTRGDIEKKPLSAKTSPIPRETNITDERCPHGMRFGIDTDKDPKWCDKCAIWDQCLDVKESGGNYLPF